jgi:putative transposase
VDIAYIPMRWGFLYLVVILDWYSRKVLSWRLSNSMVADFCFEALKDADVMISINGKGRWIDNRMIKRLWRSLKYECI